MRSAPVSYKQAVVTMWCPDHLTSTEAAEMINGKLREAGTPLVVDMVRVTDMETEPAS